MTSLTERTIIVEAVLEAITNKASQKSVCEVINLIERTLQRWHKGTQVKADMRPETKHKEPANKLSKSEYQAVLDCCNSDEHSSLPPSQIVPRLADKQEYIASESTFYRILEQENQLQYRGHSKAKKKNTKPTSYAAVKPNQVWSWDISYLSTEVIGLHYYLYLYLDIYSRKIVGADVFASESGEDAGDLLQRSMWAEHCVGQNLVLHSDNGAPMKSMTLREKCTI
jgi:putative transposase